MKNRILDAAQEEFARSGFAGTTTRQVASTAGCNVALISYYFGGKQALYEELLARHFKRVRGEYQKFNSDSKYTHEYLAQAWPEFPGNGERERRIRRFCELMLELAETVTAHPKMSRIVWREMMSGGKAAIRALGRVDSGVLPLLRKELEQFRKDGLLCKEFDSRMGVITLAAPVIWSNVAWPLLDTSMGLGKLDREYLRGLVYHGVRGLFAGWGR